MKWLDHVHQLGRAGQCTCMPFAPPRAPVKVPAAHTALLDVQAAHLVLGSSGTGKTTHYPQTTDSRSTEGETR